MVLLINGVPLEEAPRDVSAFISQYPHFKESASRLCSMKPETIGPHGLIYVFSREFAVTHPHDNKISVMGTDDITTSHIIVIKHSGNIKILHNELEFFLKSATNQGQHSNNSLYIFRNGILYSAPKEAYN